MKVISDTKKPIKIWVDNIDDVESQAVEQLRNIASLPYIFHHVAVMPDVHLGSGSTIGSVIASNGAISPAAVGVDIGCGMLALDLKTKLDDLPVLKSLRDKIENSVPLGHKGHETKQDIDKLVETASDRVKELWHKAPYQMGTLGGGNHFIEICDDGKGNAWLMLHSGSRHVGKSVADYHIKKAKKLMQIWQIDLADPDLAYLAEHTPEFNDYIKDLHWCQDYAYMNRQSMLVNILKAIGFSEKVNTEDAINCHHNYVAKENHFGKNVLITRKGAVRARQGDWGIIPGSMGTSSYIVQGKGNADSFCSCSHGAGRVMSRTKARKVFSVDDLIKQTEGVECKKDDSVLDEIPAAYKDIDTVIENQKDLIEVKFKLKSIITVKG